MGFRERCVPFAGDQCRPWQVGFHVGDIYGHDISLVVFSLCFFYGDYLSIIYVFLVMIYIYIYICHLLVYLSMVNRFINQLLSWGLRLVDVANTSLGGTMALVLILAMCNILTGISPDNEMCFPGTAERSDII